MYRLCFYVPASHLEAVKAAVFAAGAGRLGNYDSCCWEVQGRGQYRPLEGSEPYHGQEGQIESVAEYRVEMVCESDCAQAVVNALKASHPYEQPAWSMVALANGEFDD